MHVAVELVGPGRVELAGTRPTGRLWIGRQRRDRPEHGAGGLRARRRLGRVEVDVVGARSARVGERDRAGRGDRHRALARVRGILEPEVERIDARRRWQRRRVGVGITRRADCRRTYQAQHQPGYPGHEGTIYPPYRSSTSFCDVDPRRCSRHRARRSAGLGEPRNRRYSGSAGDHAQPLERKHLRRYSLAPTAQASWRSSFESRAADRSGDARSRGGDQRCRASEANVCGSQTEVPRGPSPTKKKSPPTYGSAGITSAAIDIPCR